jgi:hypothetical protein
LILTGEQSGIAHAQCVDGKRFVVRADEKLTAFLELEAAIRGSAFALTSWRRFIILGTDTKA